MLQALIIGTGKIGCDLLKKIHLSKSLKCIKFVGRSVNSPGLNFAKQLNIPTSSGGIPSVLDELDKCDMVFDTTSALDHLQHVNLLKKHVKYVINLTPAPTGYDCVPAINLSEALTHNYLDLVTCGGQASIPVIKAVQDAVNHLEYVEVISTVTSESVGLATRQNIHEYLTKTEQSIYHFTRSSLAKVALNINPSKPHVNMQTTIFIITEYNDKEKIIANIKKAIFLVNRYMPGYQLNGEILFDHKKITILLKVIGAGHYLPGYAGNLDIITAAATHIAEHIAINNS